MVGSTGVRADVLVVGGGSAGCVLASRLSEDPGRRVVLLEAGPDYGPATSDAWPPELRSSRYQPGSHDWGYVTQARGRAITQYRGRVIGGCSVINAAGITWPVPADFDHWEALGNPGWGWDGMLPFLQRAERDVDGAWEGHGRDGYLTITEVPGDSAAIESLRQVLASRGVPTLADFNDPHARQGAGRAARNAVGNDRVHLAAAYLDPARERVNLRILDRCVVDRLAWEDDRVLAVEAIRDGERITVEAELVILAAGTVGTPLVLQRSGFGDPDWLRPVLGDQARLHPLPGVGRNLWDQPGIALDFAAADGAYERLANAQAAPGMARGGPFAHLACKLKTDPAGEWFDLHVIQRHLMGPAPVPGMGFLSAQVFFLTPSQPGSIRLTSLDPEAHPEIEGGVGAPGDIEGLVRAIELERELMASPEMQQWVGYEISPGAAVQGEDLRQWVRDHLEVYHHLCGTARLGPSRDPMSVTGPDGLVHGMSNLMVADASLMPVIPRAAVHLPVIAIAEKIAAKVRGEDPLPRA